MQDWLDAYGVSHQNPINKWIHWVCVPTIFVSLIGLLSLIPFPNIIGETSLFIHFGTLLLAVGLVFFIRLSLVMAITMALISIGSLFLVFQVNFYVESQAIWWYFGAFSLAWVGQFMGHKIEGEKPSFFDDLKFLLIGPAWLAAFVLQKLQIRY